MNRFKGLDLINSVPEELWTEVQNIVQEVANKTTPGVGGEQEDKVVTWGGFANSGRMKRSEKQGRQRKVQPIKHSIPETS